MDLVWLIDPEARTVTVYRRNRGQYLVGADGELTGDDILPDPRCKVADFFYLPEELSQTGSPPAGVPQSAPAGPTTTA